MASTRICRPRPPRRLEWMRNDEARTPPMALRTGWVSRSAWIADQPTRRRASTASAVRWAAAIGLAILGPTGCSPTSSSERSGEAMRRELPAELSRLLPADVVLCHQETAESPAQHLIVYLPASARGLPGSPRPGAQEGPSLARRGATPPRRRGAGAARAAGLGAEEGPGGESPMGGARAVAARRLSLHPLGERRRRVPGARDRHRSGLVRHGRRVPPVIAASAGPTMRHPYAAGEGPRPE